MPGMLPAWPFPHLIRSAVDNGTSPGVSTDGAYIGVADGWGKASHPYFGRGFAGAEVLVADEEVSGWGWHVMLVLVGFGETLSCKLLQKSHDHDKVRFFQRLWLPNTGFRLLY